jgi:SAM-dependent methyltransferase
MFSFGTRFAVRRSGARPKAGATPRYVRIHPLDLSEVRREGAQRHPWEIARVHAVTAILQRHGARIESILDVGCGDGFVGDSLRTTLDARVLVGVDVHLADAACGVFPAANYVVERYQSADLVGDRRFDLALALDVIEHVADDRALLRDVIVRRTKPGGRVMVTVPAFQTLFSNHDHALKHFRRYNVSELRTVLTDAGLDVLEDGYFFASLLLPRVIARLRERMNHRQDDYGAGSWQGSPWLTQLMAATLTVDAELLLAIRRLGIRVPGLTAWALCSAR